MGFFVMMGFFVIPIGHQIGTVGENKLKDEARPGLHCTLKGTTLVSTKYFSTSLITKSIHINASTRE